MRTLRYVPVSLVLLFVSTVNAQDIRWYPFDKDFIANQYSNSAIGELRVKKFKPAQTIHSESCGGNDAEIHIGIKKNDIDLPDAQMPASGAVGPATKWGIVAELPNARDGDGKARLGDLENKPATFIGYFRVWDEGHAVGTVAPSNPHHVFEIHPAFAFSGEGVNFSRVDLVAAMPNYRGFGFGKFGPLLKSLGKFKWPLAYKDDDNLFVGLPFKQSNFYQLPIEVTHIKSVTGGHEITVNVFSSVNFNNQIYAALTVITASGSPIDSDLAVGDQKSLLGFFSVNLRKALGASGEADSPDNAHAIKEAVEFFVFGVSQNGPVNKCSKH
jgi:hypothetical protein